MAIICIKLKAEAALTSGVSRSIGSACSSRGDLLNSDDEARKMGDYRDILSLIRVLVHGPESKADVDSVIDRYDLLFVHNRLIFLCTPGACLSEMTTHALICSRIIEIPKIIIK